MTELDPIHELLAFLGKMIAEEEIKTRQTIQRLLSYNEPAEERIREEWRLFHERIKPMQEQREYIIKQLVIIEATKVPAPIVLNQQFTQEGEK